MISIAVTLLLIRGIKESARFNTMIVIIKVLVVVLFIVAGIGYVNTHNLGIGCQPGTEGCATFMPFGFSGVVTGAAVIFFAYIGFDAVSTAAQEAKNPQRDMPIGILGSLAICTVLYILVAGIMVGLVDYKLLTNAAAPIAVAIDAALLQAKGTTMGTILAVFPTIIKVGAVLGLSSTMVVMTMGQPRVFYSMSKDGLLPQWAAKIHPKFQTPHITTAITGVIVSILAGFVPISLLGELVSIGTLFRIRYRGNRHHHSAVVEPGVTPPVQSSAFTVHPDRDGSVGGVFDEQFAARYMDPPDRLDVHRTGDLLCI